MNKTFLGALDEALARREKWWRETSTDPDRTGTAVMLAIKEVRTAITEAMIDVEDKQKPPDDEIIKDLLEQGIPLETILASMRSKARVATKWESTP